MEGMMAKPIDIQDMRERFSYNPDLGTFTYRERPRTAFATDTAHSEWNARYAGKQAGSLKGGYVYLYANRKNILAHRVAWAMMADEQPPASIDHIDRDPGNNRWANLRDGSAINPMNRTRQRNNRSGINGVTWHKRAGKWCATIRVSGKSKHLGLFESKEAAAKVAAEARAEAGFSPLHGT
jgi:hypothetical protein